MAPFIVRIKFSLIMETLLHLSERVSKMSVDDIHGFLLKHIKINRHDEFALWFGQDELSPLRYFERTIDMESEPVFTFLVDAGVDCIADSETITFILNRVGYKFKDPK